MYGWKKCIHGNKNHLPNIMFPAVLIPGTCLTDLNRSIHVARKNYNDAGFCECDFTASGERFKVMFYKGTSLGYVV